MFICKTDLFVDQGFFSCCFSFLPQNEAKNDNGPKNEKKKQIWTSKQEAKNLFASRKTQQVGIRTPDV